MNHFAEHVDDFANSFQRDTYTAIDENTQQLNQR